MSKPKINLTTLGIKNIDILNSVSSNTDLALILNQYLDDDRKFFAILWDHYDICFDRDDGDYIKQDIYSNEAYVKDSVEYNYVLDKIIKEYHSYNKNGRNLKNIKVWG